MAVLQRDRDEIHPGEPVGVSHRINGVERVKKVKTVEEAKGSTSRGSKGSKTSKDADDVSPPLVRGGRGGGVARCLRIHSAFRTPYTAFLPYSIFARDSRV